MSTRIELPNAIWPEHQPQSLEEALALYRELLGVPDDLGADLELLDGAFTKGLEIGIALGITLDAIDLARWRQLIDAWWELFGRPR